MTRSIRNRLVFAALFSVAPIQFGTLANAQSATALQETAALQPNVVADLKASDLRKMDFFTSKILVEISNLAQVEKAKDSKGVVQKTQVLKSLSQRLTATGQKAGLSDGDIKLYFLDRLLSEYTGLYLPSLVTNRDGILDVDMLLFSKTLGQETGAAAGDSYLDQLSQTSNAPAIQND